MRLNEIKKNLRNALEEDANKIFLSSEYTQFLSGTMYALLKETEYSNINLCLYSNPSDTAATDGKRIKLSIDGVLTSFAKNNDEKYLSHIGLLFHECGHLLYTNFKSLNGLRNKFANLGHLDRNEIQSISNCQNEYTKELLDMTNVIEDMYIEKCLEKEFAGQVIKALRQNREYKKTHYGNSDELEKLALEGKLNQVHAFTYLLHDYCNVHAFKGDENWVELKPAHDLLEKLKPTVDELKVYQENAKKNKLLTKIAIEMLSLMDNSPKIQIQGGNSQGNNSQQGQQGQQNGQGSGGSNSSQNQQNQQNGQNQGDSQGQSQGQSEDQISSGQGSNGGGNKVKVAPKGKREKNLCEGKLGGEINPNLNSTGKKPKDKFDSNASNSKSLKDKKEEAKENKQIQEDLNQAIDDIAKSLYKQQAGDKEIEKALEAIRKETGENFRVIRPGCYISDYKKEYRRIKNEVMPIIKQASNLIENVLKNFEEPENETKLTSGGKVVVKDLWKQDGKCFSQYKEGDEKPDVAFGLVVDGSGSMGNTYDKEMSSAIKAAIALKEMCNKANIPCAVVSHSGSDDPVFRYATFEDDTDFQKISGCYGRGGTCDSLGLYVMGEMLLQRPEKEKIMIIVSDGSPNDMGFYGLNTIKKTKIIRDKNSHPAVDETKAVVKGFKKCGVQTYGVALFCYEDIKAIYGKDTVECQSLNELPRKLAKLLKKAVIK